MTERIQAAAILMGDGAVCVMFPPKRHHDIIRKLSSRRYKTDELGPLKQGFVTSHGRYVDRIEARKIAEAADQMLTKNPGGDQLYSEDLW